MIAINFCKDFALQNSILIFATEAEPPYNFFNSKNWPDKIFLFCLIYVKIRYFLTTLLLKMTRNYKYAIYCTLSPPPSFLFPNLYSKCNKAVLKSTRLYSKCNKAVLKVLKAQQAVPLVSLCSTCQREKV